MQTETAGQPKLTADRVRSVIRDCLFNDGEDTSQAVMANGIMTSFGFHPGRLQSHRDEIKEMLNELPDTFKQSSGGGWSFLNACVDKDERLWGEHRNMEELVCLGIASGLVEWCAPREMWRALPGGMPYFVVKDAA